MSKSRENIEAWAGDLLERKDEGKFLSEYLINRYRQNHTSEFVLNINNSWGHGKTFFIKNLAKDLQSRNYPVVYFNAWKNDYTSTPLIAFISELNTELSKHFTSSPKVMDYCKKAFHALAPIIIKKITGYGLDEINEICNQDTNLIDNKDKDDLEDGISSIISNRFKLALEEHIEIKKSILFFKKNMQQLINQIESLQKYKLPIFIFIDELDRCRPSYSIELLENIKHIFDIPGVIFVIATDSKQLSHSINAIYGDKFSSEQYLKRFFHQEYNLGAPDNYNYAKYLFSKYNLESEQKIFTPLHRELYGKFSDLNIVLFNEFSYYYNLNLRTQEQVIIVLQAITITWKEDNEPLHLAYLLYLIILREKDGKRFDDFRILKRTEYEKKNIELDKNVADTNRIKEYSNQKECKISIEEIIKFYFSLLNISFKSFKSKKPIYTFEKSILHKIRSTYHDIYDDEYKITQFLNTYPSLVARAGHFS